LLAGVIGALPGRAHEAAGRARPKRRVGGQGVFHRLETFADVVAQRLEPAPGAGLAGFDLA
jgi:hypothetical protein